MQLEPWAICQNLYVIMERNLAEIKPLKNMFHKNYLN